MLWTAFNNSIPVQRSLRLALSLTGATALALANTPIQPVAAQQEEGSAEDLGVMEIKLKDAVRFNWGFQGALQGAGIPNQAGIGVFLPIAVGENSVFFIDALAKPQNYLLVFQCGRCELIKVIIPINKYSMSLTLNRSNYLYGDAMNRLARDSLVTAIKHHPSIPTILLARTARISNIKHLKQSRHT